MNLNLMLLAIFLFLSGIHISISLTARVIDFGPKLSEFVQKHPDKGFLIKFYAPWCHYCQQLEPIFKNTAEQLYNKHDNLVIGQVDCTHSSEQCTLFDVQAYPEILYLTTTQRFKYEGDRSLESITSFSERVHGPNVNQLQTCEQLKDVTNKYGVIFVSTIDNQLSSLQQEYIATAIKFKARYWFFQFHGKCDNLIQSQGIYLSKRYFNKLLQYNASDESLGPKDGHSTMEKWVELRSFPIYGQLVDADLEHLLVPGKHLVLTLLDFYQPAAKFTPSSHALHKSFEKFARGYVHRDDHFIFAWTSDAAMIETVALQAVIIPNIMIIAPDLSYHLLLMELSELTNDNDKIVPRKLADYRLIEELLDGVKSSSVVFHGGNGIIHRLYRIFYKQYIKFRGVYQSEPILATVLMALPTTIFVYILYIIISDQRHALIDNYQIIPQELPATNENPNPDLLKGRGLGDQDEATEDEESTKTSRLNEDQELNGSLEDPDQDTVRHREVRKTD